MAHSLGERHWFVGIGYEAGGIHIRDSSRSDTRYLSSTAATTAPIASF
jgi:hypothetical protein